MSRWKWLIKWILVLPHLAVLAFLWLAFVVSTIVAGCAIMITGRYPRGLFELNVGVLRWTWRVQFYAGTGGLGTDRYPRFSLEPHATDMTRFEVDYPEQLNRRLVPIKWLLAIPHLVIVGLITGASFGLFGLLDWGGVLGLLTAVAAVVLLLTGRLPESLFDLMIGLNRWVYRLIAYVAFMTDEYPPFRLEQGGRDPATASAARTAAPPLTREQAYALSLLPTIASDQLATV